VTAFDFNTATPEEIRAESARREAKRNGVTPPDPIQEKRKATLLEKEVQQKVIALYKKHGCTVYNYSQPRKAKYLTPGAADLQVFSPLVLDLMEALKNSLAGSSTPTRSKCVMWYHETKRPKGGVYSDDQLRFAALCRSAGISVIGGGTAEAQAQLNRLNIEVPA
jgi:hypothetical protein